MPEKSTRISVLPKKVSKSLRKAWPIPFLWWWSSQVFLNSITYCLLFLVWSKSNSVLFLSSCLYSSFSPNRENNDTTQMIARHGLCFSSLFFPSIWNFIYSFSSLFCLFRLNFVTVNFHFISSLPLYFPKVLMLPLACFLYLLLTFLLQKVRNLFICTFILKKKKKKKNREKDTKFKVFPSWKI